MSQIDLPFIGSIITDAQNTINTVVKEGERIVKEGTDAVQEGGRLLKEGAERVVDEGAHMIRQGGLGALNAFSPVSKRVQVYSWVAKDNYSVEFSVPGKKIRKNQRYSWSNDDLEVDSRSLQDTFDGQFIFRVYNGNGAEVFSRTNTINAATGFIQSGNMTSLDEMQPQLVNNGEAVVAFGFYDAGPGWAGLPRAHQCWVTVTPNWAGWMASVAPLGSEQAKKPFNTFVLPGGHDCGMNSMETFGNTWSHVHDAHDVVSKIAGPLNLPSQITGVLAEVAPYVISGLSRTQTAGITSSMLLGARYFEFRPAEMSTFFDFAPRDGELYYQHMLIPGISFMRFLAEVISFLRQNQGEIAVLQIRYDGVHETCVRPSHEVVEHWIERGLKEWGGDVIKTGNKDDMKNSVAWLRNKQKRLIVLQDIGQYSSYLEDEYKTFDGSNIVKVFEGFLKNASTSLKGNDLAVWQCQATSTLKWAADLASILKPSSLALTSPLLATKARCDTQTLSWLLNNVFPTMRATVLQAIINDFLDGATVDVAIALSQKYFDDKTVGPATDPQ
ncbi:hypothetical protein JX266_011459 [Neoarthrinium moseri]|nr:hypothetical protein JX266_011459 [Neoarthrinium moseri]